METLYWSLNNGLAVTYQTVLLWNNGSGGGFPQVQDLLKGGAFVDEGVGQSSLLSSIEDQTFYDNMRDGSARIFGWTAINTVWRDADVFIVYLPYNAHIPPYTNFQVRYSRLSNVRAFAVMILLSILTDLFSHRHSNQTAKLS